MEREKNFFTLWMKKRSSLTFFPLLHTSNPLVSYHEKRLYNLSSYSSLNVICIRQCFYALSLINLRCVCRCSKLGVRANKVKLKALSSIEFFYIHYLFLTHFLVHNLCWQCSNFFLRGHEWWRHRSLEKSFTKKVQWFLLINKIVAARN